MSEIVKHKSVSITVYPWRHPSGREYWRFERTDGKHVTRSTLEKAKEAAKDHAKSVHKGALDLDTLSPDQIRKLQRIVEADPTLSLVDEFLVWHSRKRPRKRCGEAVAEFLESKRKNKGRSHHHLANLTRHLAKLPLDANMIDIRASDLPEVIGSARTRRNVIGAWITFFRWCSRRDYVPRGEDTAPELLDRPIVQKKTPATYTPAELRILLDNVRPQYLPWLALVSLGGLRTEEVIPQHGSWKEPLCWEDIDFQRKIITVRPETAKTGHKRVIPICPALAEWLKPLKGKGVIGPKLYPSKPLNAQSESETTRLGKLIGGWKRNAHRHSFISYRAALVGLAQTAMEAGNSESEAKASYNDAQSKADARRWFAVKPRRVL